MADGSEVIVQLAEPEPSPASTTSSVVPWAVSGRGGNWANPSCKGPGGSTKAQGGPQGPGRQRPRGSHKAPAHKGPRPQGPGPQGSRVAHKGPAHEGPGERTRALPKRAQGGPQGPVPQGPRGPTSAWLTRAQGIVGLWQGHRARAKATTRVVVHTRGETGTGNPFE